MDRDQIDVPEVFRRALEEVGWDDEGGRGEGSGGDGGRGCSLSLTIPLLLLLFLFLGFNWIVTTYTEWLWFRELRFESLWLKQWGFQIGSFLFFFGVAALFLLFNWHLARRGSGIERVWGALVGPTLAGYARGITTAAGLLAAFFLGSAGAANWELILRYLYRVPFGQSDPIFGRDLSFFLFDVPLYGLARGWIMSLLFLTALGVVVLYGAGAWQRLQTEPQQLLSIPSLRRHLALLGAVFFTLWAAGYWLDTFGLLRSPFGVVVGATYTDVTARLLALRVQTVLMGLLALAVLVNVVRLDARLPLAAGGLWLVAGLLLGGLYPALLQRYTVEPNELAREQEYIAHNIAFSRLGFNLHQVRVEDFGEIEPLAPEELTANEELIRNIRVWDYRPLKETYSQLQELRPYYEFNEIDIDRYEIDGLVRQVMLAPRELNKAQLSSPTWVNQKLEYTHGYGLVMSPVDRVTDAGRPDFFIRDLPPQSTVPIQVDRPEVYFGELTTDEVLVASNLPEFDYPSGSENVYSSYAGLGGILLDSRLDRLAFAARFGEVNLLLSQYVTPNTRVLMHRQIQDRVQRITPFLTLDQDPYIVVADGRLVWMIDAYTWSSEFPYSTPVEGGLNYIRNAAKITVDAYDGTVTYYLADPDDPLVQSYARAFPDLFRPLDEMPPSLSSHIRYPTDLFKIQVEQYQTYHMTDVQVFYNKEDLWEIPQELFDQNQQLELEPYYVYFSLPGETEGEYLLIMPYVPRGKQNMIGWLAARNDPAHYGELVVYELPKQELVFGPLQIEARIDQDPLISQQLSLWSQRGSQVIRGNLIVFPVGQNFLYVEPIYLQSENTALPELKRVILASGDNLVMRTTLDEALAALLDATPVSADIDSTDLDGFDPPSTDVTTGTPPPPLDSTVETLIATANQQFLAAETAQRNGNWEEYGRQIEALELTLQQLLELTTEAEPAGAGLR